MSTSKEEIKEELMEMFYYIITGDQPGKSEVAEKVEAYWNSFLTQIKKGYRFMKESESK